jgi:hypothetical protein
MKPLFFNWEIFLSGRQTAKKSGMEKNRFLLLEQCDQIRRNFAILVAISD